MRSTISTSSGQDHFNGDYLKFGDEADTKAVRPPRRGESNPGHDRNQGDLWRPFYYLLEKGPVEIMLVNL